MSVAPAISSISRPETAGIPYLTPEEFQNAPMGIQLNNLIPGAGTPQQTQALQAAILRASSWMDLQCHQVLAATTDTEISRGRMRRDGSIYVFTRCFPIREVTSVAVNYQPLNFVPMTSLSSVVPLNRAFVIYQPVFPAVSNLGPIQFGPPYTFWEETWVQYSYVNGYPVTSLSAACISGATTITLLSALGVIPGMTLTISDIPNTETVIVSSVSENVVTLQVGTQSAHAKGIYVSALPDGVKQAAILATAGFIQERGTGALVMASLSGAPAKQNSPSGGGPSDLQQALAILQEGGFVAQVSLPSQL
ncbi:MAG: hypothetical protein WBF51_04250 [Candidatus Dormiibacterota bacterium]